MLSKAFIIMVLIIFAEVSFRQIGCRFLGYFVLPLHLYSSDKIFPCQDSKSKSFSLQKSQTRFVNNVKPSGRRFVGMSDVTPITPGAFSLPLPLIADTTSSKMGSG